MASSSRLKVSPGLVATAKPATQQGRSDTGMGPTGTDTQTQKRRQGKAEMTHTEQRMYDLKFERMGNGAVRLTQSDSGEDCIIDAHPGQILFVARQLCGMKPDAAHEVAELERRISVLADRLGELVTADWFRGEIIDRSSHGIEMIVRLDGLLDLAMEYDGGRLLPERDEETHEAPTANELTAGDRQIPPQQFELA
jgi:hypothetical protein